MQVGKTGSMLKPDAGMSVRSFASATDINILKNYLRLVFNKPHPFRTIRGQLHA